MFEQDKVQQRFYELMRQKQQQDDEYSLRLEVVQGDLKTKERKHFDLSGRVLMLKGDRDESKNRLFREQIKYQNSVDQHKKLEQEFQELLDYEVELK